MCDDHTQPLQLPFVCIRLTISVRTTPVHIHSQGKDYLVTCFGTTRGLRRYCIISGLGMFQAPSELRELENESSVLPSPLFSFSLPELTDTPGRASHMLLSSQMSGLIVKALCVFVFTRCQPSLIYTVRLLPGGMGYSLIWLIQGCAAGQGMVFVFFVLKRVYNHDNFAQVCPQQGI